ncbi:MAG: pilus assembly protein PilM [Planctomycetota bacterium]
MFPANAVSLDRGSTAMRLLWLRGSTGNLEVVKAVRLDRKQEDVRLTQLLVEGRQRKIPTSGVVLGIPGRGATLRYNQVPPVPDWRLELIMKYETQEMAEKSGEPLSTDYMQLLIPESETDNRILLVGLGRESELGPVVEEIEQSGGRVRAAIPHALGLFNAYQQSFKIPPRETVLLADVGAQETQIVLVCDGRLLFARSVRFGGDQIDEILARELGIRVEAARKMKEGMGSGRVPGHLIESAQSAIRSAFGQLFSVLHSSVTFCRAQTKIPEITLDRVLLSGRGSRVPGLAAFLEECFEVPVETFQPNVKGAELPGDASEWVIPIGLAASQFESDRGTLDLLPASAKAKRDFRERTVFLYGAAAVLVLAVLVQFGAAFVENLRVSRAQGQLQAHRDELKHWEQDFASAKRENQKYRSQIHRLRREVQVSRFFAQVLDLLRSELPAPISLEGIELERVQVEGQLGIAVKIRGFADNSDRKGIDHINSLHKVLERQSWVETVKPDIGRLAAGAYPFEIRATPDAELPTQNTKKRSGRSSRRTGRGF